MGSADHLGQCLGRSELSSTHLWAGLRLREGLLLFTAASPVPAPLRLPACWEVNLQRLLLHPAGLGLRYRLPALPLALAGPHR